MWAAHLLEQLPLQSQNLCNDLIIWCCHEQLGVVLEDLPLLLRGTRVLDACRGHVGVLLSYLPMSHSTAAAPVSCTVPHIQACSGPIGPKVLEWTCCQQV